MQTLKRYVRSTKNPLLQTANRLDEYEMLSNSGLSVSEEHTADISVNFPDNCFLVANGNYGLCREILPNKIEVLCEVFMNSSSLYEQPCDSRLLGIHKVLLKSSRMMTIPLVNILKKAVCSHE